MGILGRPSEAEAGMKAARDDPSAGHQQLGDEEQSKKKPHCTASCGGIQESSVVAHKGPREPKIAPLFLAFLEKQ